jgi:Fe2+ transport system protein B
MEIVPLSAVDADQRALDRLLKERTQRDQARLAQLQADADAERTRLENEREQQRLDELRAQADDERLQQQRELSSRTVSQHDTLLRQTDRVAELRLRSGESVDQHLLDERVRIEGQNAYRAQSTPPPSASSLTDQLA